MISPTRRFVLATDGRPSAFECRATVNLSSLPVDVMEAAARMSSSLSLFFPVLLLGVDRVVDLFKRTLLASRILPHLHSTSHPSHLIIILVSCLLLTSTKIENQRCILRDDSPTPPSLSIQPEVCVRSIRNCKPIRNPALCTPPLLLQPATCKPGSISPSLSHGGFIIMSSLCSQSASPPPARHASHEKESRMQSNVLDLIQSFPSCPILSY
jgi:hypothetical protein